MRAGFNDHLGLIGASALSKRDKALEDKRRCERVPETVPGTRPFQAEREGGDEGREAEVPVTPARRREPAVA
jgi:hypothetical protein